MRNRILIYGYHGMRNTGADARLLVIRDVLREMVPDAELVVPTFAPGGLDFVDDVTIRHIHPATYPWAAKPLIREADAMILSEGNMLTDEFSKHLVEAFVTALRQAHARDCPSVGLALDSGKLEPKRQPRVRDALNTTALLTVRSAGARDALSALGVNGRLTETADCAVSMSQLESAERARVRESVGLTAPRIHGIAPVDFYMWPAKIRLFGRREDFVRWPFKGTWPNDGRRQSEALAAEWARYCNHLLDDDPEATVALIAMEAVDQRFCRHIRARLSDPDRAVEVRCTELSPKQMAACLEGLASLVTSRYHALVLSLPFRVPYIALGHDTRTQYISREMGLGEWFVDYQERHLGNRLLDKHRALLLSREAVRERISAGLAELRRKDRRNYELLRELLADIGYRPNPLPEAIGEAA
ncbi:polysaccharide pyruvyl transferase family protein [Arhodomonas sp. AD133]|uniref:polysaccharide pyruvyl transferase family protein n=1 Tax=Arhodomonas sp. AD133 TaxID=3415009 RepID=UPI003EBE4D5E